MLWKNFQTEKSAVRLSNTGKGKHGTEDNKKLNLRNTFNNWHDEVKFWLSEGDQ